MYTKRCYQNNQTIPSKKGIYLARILGAIVIAEVIEKDGHLLARIWEPSTFSDGDSNYHNEDEYSSVEEYTILNWSKELTECDIWHEDLA